MTTTTHPCSGSTYHGRIGFLPCVNAGKVERDGRWYCGIHDPVKVAARKAKRDAAETVERLRRQALVDEAEAVAQRLTALLGVRVQTLHNAFDRGHPNVPRSVGMTIKDAATLAARLTGDTNP